MVSFLTGNHSVLIGSKTLLLPLFRQIRRMVGVGVDVDVLGFQLGVEYGLAGVETAVAGEHIADAAGHSKVQQALRTKQLHR